MSVKNLEVCDLKSVDLKLNKEMPTFLEYIKKLIKADEISLDKNFGDCSPAYLKTTENINGCYNLLNFYNKDVLTVVGSGDHVFNAVLRSAKKVDGFDISIMSIMFYYLKEAALKSLDYEDYINFFLVERICYDKEIYKKIVKNLNPIAVDFWNLIFLNNSNTNDIILSFIRDKRLYPNFAYVDRKLSPISGYLREENYYKLQRKINDCDINIYHSNFLDKEFSNNYDYIILSNIFEYQKGTDIERFKEVIEEYRNNLNNNGKIIVGYAYHDVDVHDYQEYDIVEIPSIFTIQGIYGAPNDKIISVGQKRL